jgi:hypothetical protein
MAPAHFCLDIGPVPAVLHSGAFADGRTIGGRRGCRSGDASRRRGHPGADRQSDDDLVSVETLEVLCTEPGCYLLGQPPGVRGRGLKDDAGASVGQDRLPDLRRELAKVLIRQGEPKPERPGLG